VVPQPAVASAASAATPKKAASKKTAKPAASKTKAAGTAGDADDDDDGGEDIIPMKVPMSDSDDEDASGGKDLPSPGKSASGAREKTFLSEVDLEDMKPVPAGTDARSTQSSILFARFE
jgi:hypothetical protein